MSVKPINLLRNAYGHDIILIENSRESVAYRIVAEFEYESSRYAVLQTEKQRKDDEFSFFKVSTVTHEPFFELETIQDDDEWETVSELYDEFVFNQLYSSEDELDGRTR